MGAAKQKGNFEIRQHFALIDKAGKEQAQNEHTIAFNHAIEMVVKDVLVKWEMSGHPLLYIDFSILESILPVNDYSEEMSKYKA